MNEKQAQELALEINATPGYTVLDKREFPYAVALLVHEDASGWDQWVAYQSSWDRIKRLGYQGIEQQLERELDASEAREYRRLGI